jgi:hypothetical protein
MGAGTADGAGLTKILVVAVAALAAVWITRRRASRPGVRRSSSAVKRVV